MLMNHCPRCGYEPLPKATCTPEVVKGLWKDQWDVRVWVDGEDHRWVRTFTDRTAAEDFAAEIESERLRTSNPIIGDDY